LRGGDCGKREGGWGRRTILKRKDGFKVERRIGLLLSLVARWKAYKVGYEIKRKQKTGKTPRYSAMQNSIEGIIGRIKRLPE